MKKVYIIEKKNKKEYNVFAYGYFGGFYMGGL